MKTNKRGVGIGKGQCLMMLSSAFVCLGQLGWKIGATSMAVLPLMIGFGLYAAGALTMLYAYRFGKMSALQPILSLNYVFSTLLGAAVLGETIGIKNIAGIVIIIIGVVLIGGESGQ